MVEARKSSRPWGVGRTRLPGKRGPGGVGKRGGGCETTRLRAGSYEYGAPKRCSLTNRGNKGLNLSGS